ncbi:cupin domain-containing protein [Lysobacter niastensis]|uniref:Cupin domain-containing protein n=1 Tax=Lysobacter niastensis TaxID=380629 RepID=A0ABS0B4U5_9GAMM|nr:cupin domain-containing protein [Lysobacter niastensis]MBF6023728.1 cupin domain-containing protein [Lysobacter niastensis]
MKTSLAVASATVALAVLFPFAAAEAQQAKPQSWPGIKRTDLQRHDLSAPGREVIQVHVDFAPGAAVPAHSHPGEEIVYAIEGAMEYQVEGQSPVTLKSGDVLFIPAGAIHSVKNAGSGNAAELATYIVEKGKPLLVGK